MKNKMEELYTNQTHILEAIQNLNERLIKIEENFDDKIVDEIKEIVETRAVLDDVVVKTSDHITALMKGKDVNKDAITKLTKESNNNQKSMEETMRKLGDEIEHIDNKIKLLDIKEEQSLRVRRCSFYNRGYCRLQSDCPFYHPENRCEEYENEGFCIKTICRDRHQRTCRYWKRGQCYRAETCNFSHRDIKDKFNVNKQKPCYKCKNETLHLYYCDLCDKDFCSDCTVAMAHDGNYNKFTDIVECRLIHQVMTNEDEPEMTVDDGENTISKICQCKKAAKVDLFECEKCQIYFCEDCAMYPIPDQTNCLKCMASEILTSTPNKNSEV